MDVFAISGAGGVRYNLAANLHWVLRPERP